MYSIVALQIAIKRYIHEHDDDPNPIVRSKPAVTTHVTAEMIAARACRAVAWTARIFKPSAATAVGS